MARILYAEDAELTATVVRRFLSEAGHEAQVATTLNGALALIATSDFDLIISDGNLTPHGSASIGDAKEILEAAKERGRGTPVILATGQAVSSEQASGFCRVLAKPFDLEVLKRIVSSVLEETASRRGTAGSQKKPAPQHLSLAAQQAPDRDHLTVLRAAGRTHIVQEHGKRGRRVPDCARKGRLSC